MIDVVSLGIIFGIFIGASAVIIVLIISFITSVFGR